MKLVMLIILQSLLVQQTYANNGNFHNSELGQTRKLKIFKEHTQLLITMTLNTFDCDTFEISKSTIEKKWEKFLQCETCATVFSLDTCQSQPQILVRVIDSESEPKQLQKLINTIAFNVDCINNFFRQFGEINLEIQSYTPIINSKIKVYNLSDSEVVKNARQNPEFFPVLDACNLNLSENEILKIESQHGKNQPQQNFVQSLKNSFWNPDQKELKSQILPQQMQLSKSEFSTAPSTEIKTNFATNQQKLQFSNNQFNRRIQIEPTSEIENLNIQIQKKENNQVLQSKNLSQSKTVNSAENDEYDYYYDNTDINIPGSVILQHPDATNQQLQNQDGQNNKQRVNQILIYTSIGAAIIIACGFIVIFVQRYLAYKLADKILPVSNEA